MSSRCDLVIGTAGHIDHGKTSLVRALTGVDTDRLPAEKQRGITIDLGFAFLELPPLRFSLVDVPGHERFIRNMVAGATGIDLALLVIAADDSVMPQTREHLEILSYLNVSGGVIALTKADLVTPEWLLLVQDEIRDLVAGTFLENAPLVPVSSLTGAGLDQLRDSIRTVGLSLDARVDPGLFRLPVDRVFTIPGHGTVVTGTVASGQVRPGDELECWPSGRKVRVRGIQRNDESVEYLGRGNRLALNLVGVHHTEIQRGCELATPGYLETTCWLTAEIKISSTAPWPLRHRKPYLVHLGTTETPATLILLDGLELQAGERAFVQLQLNQPVVAVANEPLILREESPAHTVAGGRILEPTAVKAKRRDLQALQRWQQLATGETTSRLADCLGRLPFRHWSPEALVRETGIAVDALGQAMTQLQEADVLTELPLTSRRLVPVSRAAEATLSERILKFLDRLHQARPRQSGIRRGDVVASLCSLGPEPLIQALIDRLAARGDLLVDNRTVARKDHAPRLSQAERALKQQMLLALRNGGLRPPDGSELAVAAGSRAAIVPELLALLQEEGQIVEIGPGIWFEADTEAMIRRVVRDHLSSPGVMPMSMAELRDLLATTRKYAVPIGEYLDRIGLTRREGDLRVLAEPQANQGVREALESTSP